LQQRTGIVVQDHQLQKLHQTVHNACQRFHLPDPDAYLLALQANSEFSSEFEYLISGITVGESYFFRDESQMTFLRQVYFPQVIAQRRAQGNLSLRIWSAGCSAGQEIYSIAIMLQELLPDIADWRLDLLGTDINSEVLTKAMKGRYSAWSLRAISDEHQQRYFQKIQDYYLLDGDIRKMARFAYLNLSDDCYPSILNGIHSLDLILCRNVFIYLQHPMIDRVVEKMRDSLCYEAILMLGATDTFSFTTPDLTIYNQGFVHYYRKAVAECPELPLYHDVEPEQFIDRSALPDISADTKEAKPSVSNPDYSDTTDRTFDHEAAIELIHQEKWLDLLDSTAVVAEADNGRLLQYRAKALANLGRLDEASECCNRALSLNATDKHTYFIHGLVLQELGQMAEAETAFNKTLYLDRYCVEAYYQLGLLMIRSGRTKAGIRNLENAQREAERRDPERQIHDTNSITYARFAQIVNNEIVMYKELFAATV